MRVLLVGSGGREHALAWNLSKDAEVLVAPGNAGIATEFECAPVAQDDQEKIIELCQDRRIGLVVVGPEDPLIRGLADSLRAASIPVFGPGSQAAKLEGSKAFSKELMRLSGVPTAEFAVFTDFAAASGHVRNQYSSGQQLAVKASGNALGRGAVLCSTEEEALDALRRMMVEREFGSAGEEVVLEERLIGREFSLLTLVSEGGFVSLPVAQDHKRVGTGDVGPNTGGMGAFCPADWVTADLLAQTESEVVAPILNALMAEGTPFQGTLFSGLMVTESGPKCLEYNVRFGDPETQAVMRLVSGGLLNSLHACARGIRPEAPIISQAHSVSVVAAAEGYPGLVRRGDPIQVAELREGVKIFYAGVQEQEGQLVTSGGRVLHVTAVGETLEQARASAYAAMEGVHFTGIHYRTDIGGMAAGTLPT